MAASCHAEEVTALGEGRSTANAGQVYWLGFAVSPAGRVFRSENSGGSEQQARQRAKNECEMQAGSTCEAIAVPSAWDVSAVACRGGSFVAGSNMGYAQDRAKMKAADSGLSAGSCREIYRY